MRSFLCIVMLTSCSFVPAESATLGLVDKSRFSVAGGNDVLTHDQFLLAFKRANLSPRFSWTMSAAPSSYAPDLEFPFLGTIGFHD